MSATSTVICIAISRMVMQRWAEVERVKTYPYEASEKEVKRSVVDSHYRTLRENRSSRRVRTV